MDVTTPLDVVRAEYLESIVQGDRLGAIELLMTALEEGASAEELIEQVIARGQGQIGQGWLEGRWSVAMEHRASGIAESALSAVAETAVRAPGAVREGSAGRAVVACSEGEWHALPGRMASEVLRLRGVDVTFVGPSVPAHELAEMIGDDPPSVVAVTCSMPLSLAGTWRTITALRGLGAHIVCGGRGFGDDGHWGLAIGADAWAPGLASGADLIVAALGQPRPAARGPAGSEAAAAETAEMTSQQTPIVDRALAAALSLRPELADSDSGVGQMRQELGGNLKALCASTITGDAGLMVDHARWLEELLSARGLPLSLVPTALDLLRQALPDGLPLARGVLDVAIDSCSAQPARSGGDIRY